MTKFTLNHSEAYNPGALNIFMLWYSCQHHMSQDFSLFLTPQLCTHHRLTLHPSTTVPNTQLLPSVSVNLTTHIYLSKWSHRYLSFCVWLFSLRIMSLRLIHVVAESSFILRLNGILLYAHTFCSSCHLSADIQHCFHFLTPVDNAAMNMGVHTSGQVLAFSFLGYVSTNGTAGSHGDSIFRFWTAPHSSRMTLHSQQ